MDFKHAILEDCPVHSEAVVVIDVCRAFTTAAFALGRGAERIILVSSVAEAFELRKQNPDWLLMGEENGLPVPGFDLWNSPAEVDGKSLTGKTLVQRTSAGTQGVVRCRGAKILLASSFVVAGATVQYLLQKDPEEVTFLATGVKSGRAGVEDVACAEYLQACMQATDPSPEPYLERAKEWTSNLVTDDASLLQSLDEDLDRCLQVDRFHFPLVVHISDGLPEILLPIRI